MVKKVQGYKCEKCGCIHVSLEEAEICEAAHASPACIEACEYTRRGDIFPKSIDIRFENDKRVVIITYFLSIGE